MRPVTRGVAALLLSIAAAAMLGGAALGTARASPTSSPVVVALVSLPALALVGYVAVMESRVTLGAGVGNRLALDVASVLTVAAVTVGAPLTRVLAVDLGLGVVVAAALVGLLADRVVPDLGAAVYCGTFVGMAAPALFGSVWLVTAAGLVAGLLFVAGDGVFDGFGGKLGTTAFGGCAAVALATGASGAAAGGGAMPSAVAVTVAGAASAVLTQVSSVRLDHGPVQASALVGLVGGLVCPPLFVAGDALAAVVFCASFAGMAQPARVPGVGAMALAGALCGLLVAATAPVFVGAGGKLGTIAFTACLLVRGLLAVGTSATSLPLPTATDGLDG